MPHFPRTTFAIIAAATIAAILPLDIALACSCARNPTAAGILNHSAAVFSGVALKSVSAKPGYSITTFKVTESFKGATAGASVPVYHRNVSTGSCGVKFSAGQSYTLAARQSDSLPGLSASFCSTWIFSPKRKFTAQLIAEMRALRQAAQPTTPRTMSPQPVQGTITVPTPGNLQDLDKLD